MNLLCGSFGSLILFNIISHEILRNLDLKAFIRFSLKIRYTARITTPLVSLQKPIDSH